MLERRVCFISGLKVVGGTGFNSETSNEVWRIWKEGKGMGHKPCLWNERRPPFGLRNFWRNYPVSCLESHHPSLIRSSRWLIPTLGEIPLVKGIDISQISYSDISI